MDFDFYECNREDIHWITEWLSYKPINLFPSTTKTPLRRLSSNNQEMEEQYTERVLSLKGWDIDDEFISPMLATLKRVNFI